MDSERERADLTAVLLGGAEARRLTDQVKRDASDLWAKLLALYEGGAHFALGYSSWGSYFEREFGGDASQGYRILDAARVQEALAAEALRGHAASPSFRSQRRRQHGQSSLSSFAFRRCSSLQSGKDGR